jgi:hypothetical protein
MRVTAATFHRDKSLVNVLARWNILCHRSEQSNEHEPSAEKAATAKTPRRHDCG